jgi:hypothetical protein
VTLTSSAATSYQWSTGATTQSIAVGSTGTYYVTTKDAAGCTATSSSIAVNVTAVPSGSTTFNYNGSYQTFTVPTCISSLTIDMAGAAGGAGTAYAGVGGLGGRMQGTYSVAAGTVLEVYVGGKGNSTSSTSNVGGYNGGAPALITTYYVGTGGGASDIRVSPYGLGQRVIVAGGGGGASYNYDSSNDNGGAGGGLTGGAGPGPSGTGDGAGGTQTGGGANATYDGWSTVSGGGGLGVGGTSNCSEPGSSPTDYAGDGGGGGGGYYGGGGGCWEGGGGGSSYASSAVTVTGDTQGYSAATGNGYVTITW